MTTTNGKTRCKYCDLDEALQAEAATHSTLQAAVDFLAGEGHPLALKTVWSHRKQCDGQVKAPARTKGKKKKGVQPEKEPTPSVGSSVKFDEKTGIPVEVSAVCSTNDHEAAWAEVAAQLKISLPEGYIARCVEAKHDPAAWVRYGTHAEYSAENKSYLLDANGEVVPGSVKVSEVNRVAPMPATTQAVWRLRFVIVKEEGTAGTLADDSQDAMDWMRKWKTPAPMRRTLGAGLGEPCTSVYQQGDEQIGKGEGGGIKGLIERQAATMERFVDRVERDMKSGVNLEAIALPRCGDSIENIFGHYNSQTRTTDTLRNQLKAARDMELFMLQSVVGFGLPIEVEYTPSNHGEMRQAVGQSPYTSASDNLDLIIAETVQDLVALSSFADQVTFKIPHDEVITTFSLSGVNCALTHGHKVSGGIPAWVVKQRDHYSFHRSYRIELFMFGHKHHFYCEDVSGTTIMQAGSLDGGSPYFENLTGQRSMHGAVSYLVGRGFKSYWGQLEVL